MFFKRSIAAGIGSLCLLAAGAVGQQSSIKLVVEAPRPMTLTGTNNIYCAGFVQTSPISTENKVIGGLEEQEQFNYAQNDVLYINMGSNKGVKAGDILSVVRPRGEVATRWTKKGDLGFYVEEVGALEVVRVKSDVSVARVKTSCAAFKLGDLVQPVPSRSTPMFEPRPAMDLFPEPSGKATGRLFMARDNREMIGTQQIVYVDLGADDNVQVGDRLTIFRPLGKGHLFVSDEAESVSARDEGFQSDKYRGGKFSNQAARKAGETAEGRVVTTEKAKEGRPAIRKVVGEMVVLNVKEKTATAVVTRVAQEVHTGDWVEIQ